MLAEMGAPELAGDGFEGRLVVLARRLQVSLLELVRILASVGKRCGELTREKPVGERRAYLFKSVENEHALTAAWMPSASLVHEGCKPRRRRHLLGMDERSLGDAGKQVLALLRAKEALSKIASVDFAHRISQHTIENASGGRLPLVDALHVIGQVAENEADMVAAGSPRLLQQLVAYVMGCLKRAAPGCAKQAEESGATSARGTTGPGPARGRNYEPQKTGTTGPTWEF